VPIAFGPTAALLQSAGANAWGPLTALAVGIYGAVVVLCFVIGGGFLSTGALDAESKTKGIAWVKRGFVGGSFGMLAFSIYQLYSGMF
jgi:hypothetical protein